MSIGLSIQFLTGRYHATPWDHQVNEGVVEWPPSPWRLLRALVSAYYRLLEPPSRFELYQIVTQLAEQLPSYIVPEYTTAHTRHYMPIRKEGKATTTKVIDTFLAFPGGALSDQSLIKVIWSDVHFSESQIALLKQLCQQVNYLGRAESWAEMKLANDTADFSENMTNITPAQVFELSQSENKLDKERVKVLVPLTAAEMEGFKAAIATLPKPKKSKNQWRAPTNILEALEVDIGNLHSQGWNGIPGTRWATYIIKYPTKKPPSQLTIHHRNSQKPNFARFALASNVLPNLTEAVFVGERFRQGLMAWSRNDLQQPAIVFSGKKPTNTIECKEEQIQKIDYLEGQKHAWYLPEVNQQGKIDYIVIYAAAGFDSEQAIPALKNLSKIWGSEGFDIQTILVALGQVADYTTEPWRQGSKYGVIGVSNRWRSLTPMVLPRHPKFYRNSEKKYIPNTNFQIDGPEDQALKLLTHLPFVALPLEKCVKQAQGEWLCLTTSDDKVLVKARCCNQGVTQYQWQNFKRHRHHGHGQKSSNRGYWLELEFAEPQHGPIALGYAAHFGLGVFTPVK